MRKWCFAAALVPLVLAGCEKDAVSPRLSADGELQIRPVVAHSVAGRPVPLNAVAFDPAGRAVFTESTWSTLDSTVATVDVNGLVTPVSSGWARIVARSVAGPVDTAVVAVGLSFAQIAAARDFGCGLTAGGKAYCWGGGFASGAGALGTGTAPTLSNAQPVAGAQSYTSIAVAERHTCAIALGGEVYCWGYAGSSSGLKTGTCLAPAEFNRGCHVPARVQITGSFKKIAVSSGNFSCASGDGGLVCWGSSNMLPYLGCSGSTCAEAPVQASALTGPVALGLAFGCALDASGRAYCWGDNSRGQLGALVPPDWCATSACVAARVPVAVQTNERFTDIVAGSTFTCGIAADGRATCWGSYRRFGSVIGPPGRYPVAIEGGLRFRTLDAGDGHVCGLTTDDAAYCWGSAEADGVFGAPNVSYGTVLDEPRHITMQKFRALAAGSVFTCALTVDGETMCMGVGPGLGQNSYSSYSLLMVPLAPPGPYPAYLPIR